MTGRKFRIQSLLVITSLLFVGTATILFYLAATLSESPGRSFLWIALALAVVLSFAATRLGRALSQSLHRLRSELPDLARGDVSEPQLRSRLAEVDALSSAIGRLTQDVHARERAAVLERSSISDLLEAGSEGLLQVNEAVRIVYLNSAARKLLSLPADARGQAVSTLLRQADLRDLIVRAVAGETVEPRELTLEDRHLMVTCQPIPGSRGAVVVVLDFTDIRRLEAVRRDFVGN